MKRMEISVANLCKSFCGMNKEPLNLVVTLNAQVQRAKTIAHCRNVRALGRVSYID